jgi:hypothetical protein
MFVEAALLAWTALALGWWGISLALVRSGMRKTDEDKSSALPSLPVRTLTIFKPLAPLGRAEFDPRGIASFLAQLGEEDELLLGAHESDRTKLEPALESLTATYPTAPWRVIWRSEPDAVANPKVAWLQLLAPHARGELWLWSDSDIVAPAGFLRSAREEYASAGTKLLTWPYMVREAAAGPALLDALYVNAEFFPGVLLLRQRGPVDFSLGAGMLFARADFESAVSWTELDAALADDFVLGQKLQPVRIGRAVLRTAASEQTWRTAILHYLRWSKTVRWCRPGGTAARIAILPVLGWLAFALLRPALPLGWLGLAGTMQMDVLAAALIFRRIGCRIAWRHLSALELWSLGRALAWLACWLPWPVTWAGRRWWGPVAR